MRKFFLASFIVILTMVARISVHAAQGWPANYSGVMLQGFYWDSYDDSKWYKLTERADELSKYFDLIWIPNAATETTVSDYESTTQSMGYTPIYYFKYNTIFGSEDQLREMINTYKAKGTGIIEDVVINHKSGVTGWCDFANETIVGQNTGKTYSVSWDNTTYTGICKNDEANSDTNSEGCGKIKGATDTGDNFDGSRDLDHTNTTVQQNLITYQDYLLNELGFAGFRLDMVKGYSGIYTKMYNEAVNPTYSVGEYWDTKDNITNWINTTGKTSAAFDFPLKFVLNSVFDNGNWDALSDKSFTADVNYNRYSVTFVENHDTFRSNKLNNSWSAANAFILAMPGTPCIFLPHYTADPTHIQAMINARKAVGLTNQSSILQQYKYNNGYVIETQGTNGSAYLQLGDATGQTAPDKYFLVASATDGTPYKFFTKKNSTQTTTSDYTIYFDNSTGNWDNVYCYTWDANGNWTTAWPGTKLTEKDASGRYFKYTVSANDSYGVIFNNGNGTQTDNLAMANKCVYRSTGVEHDNYCELTDGTEFSGTSDCFYSEASYSRTSSNEWGTLCLPFAYTGNSNTKFYTFKSYDTDYATVSEVENVKAGQPVIYRILSQDASDNKYHLSIISENVLVKASSYGKTDTPAEGWTMKGTYSDTNIQNSGNTYEYFIANNEFWNAEVTTSVSAYRAWLESTVSKAKSITIFMDDETNAINPVTFTEKTENGIMHNLQGQRVKSPRQGQLIISNGKKYIAR